MATENMEIWDNPKAFRQQVRLASVQVAALGVDELASALAYEIEPFSKIPAAEADVAWRESAESNSAVKVYDVAVLPRRAKGRSPLDAASRRLNAIVAIVALLAVAAVALDWFALSSRRSRLAGEVAVQMRLDDELRRLEGRESALRSEARAIREGRETAERAQERVAKMRSSLPDALGAVASVCGGSMVVKEISSPSPFEMEFRAIAVTAEGAAATMARLGDVAASRGWRLEPGAVAANSSGAVVEFSFRLLCLDEGGAQ